MESSDFESRKQERWIAAANRIAEGHHQYKRRVVAYHAGLALKLKKKRDKQEAEDREKELAMQRQQRMAEFRVRAPKAVECIAAAWRGYAERHLHRTMVQIRIARNSATRIQRNYRQRLASYRVSAILRVRDDQLRSRARLRQEAASVRSLGHSNRIEQK